MQENIRFVKGQRNSRKAIDVDNSSKGLDRMMNKEKIPFRDRSRLCRWRFKSCPKCGGDLSSCYGEDFTCFQCGLVIYSWIKNEDKKNNA